MYYVYEWFIVETGEVIYVGKGTHNRYKAKKKNKFLNRLLETDNCNVRIIAYYATEEEAFEAEKERILYLKSINQAICNKYTRKTGGVGRVWTEEKRRNMSINNPMKREEQRERMSRLNPMKNPKTAELVFSQRRKPVFIGDHNFSCAKEAAKYFNVSSTTIWSWVKRGYGRLGLKCGYIKIKKNTPKIEISKKELPDETIVYNGIEFENAIEVAKYAGIKDKRTIIRWCNKGFSPDGIHCRFKNDTKIYEYHKPNKSHGKPVVVQGTKYKSRRDACFALKCDYKKLYQILKQENEQANQQPSLGNSDNSTQEGSTTRD